MTARATSPTLDYLQGNLRQTHSVILKRDRSQLFYLGKGASGSCSKKSRPLRRYPEYSRANSYPWSSS